MFPGLILIVLFLPTNYFKMLWPVLQFYRIRNSCKVLSRWLQVQGTSFGESLKNFGLLDQLLFVLLLLLLFLFLGFLALLTKSVVSTRSRLDSVTGAGNRIHHVNYQRCLRNSSLTQMTKLATFTFPWNCCLQWVVWKAASSQTELSSAGST